MGPPSRTGLPATVPFAFPVRRFLRILRPDHDAGREGPEDRVQARDQATGPIPGPNREPIRELGRGRDQPPSPPSTCPGRPKPRQRGQADDHPTPWPRRRVSRATPGAPATRPHRRWCPRRHPATGRRAYPPLTPRTAGHSARRAAAPTGPIRWTRAPRTTRMSGSVTQAPRPRRPRPSRPEPRSARNRSTAPCTVLASAHARLPLDEMHRVTDLHSGCAGHPGPPTGTPPGRRPGTGRLGWCRPVRTRQRCSRSRCARLDSRPGPRPGWGRRSATSGMAGGERDTQRDSQRDGRDRQRNVDTGRD